MGKDLEKSVGNVRNVMSGDCSKYRVKYVAITSSVNMRVVAYGKNLVEVARQAVEKVGKGNFFTTLVHDPDEAYAGG